MTSKNQRRGTKREIWVVAVLVVVAAGLISFLALRPSPSDTAGTTPPPATSVRQSTEAAAAGPLGDLARHDPADPLALGSVGAPVTMVAYSDYRCPFCAKFSRETEPQLIARYVDRGTLRIEWRDFPIFGDQSMVAARAGRAAAAQGRFWPFTRAVYAAAPQTGHPDLTEDALVGFARAAGVGDLERFKREMTGHTFDAAIRRDLDQGQGVGVPSTPAFIINGTPVLGAQPIEEFTSAIERAAGRS